MPRSRLTLGKQLGKGQPTHTNTITDAARSRNRLSVVKGEETGSGCTPVRESPNYYHNYVAANVICLLWKLCHMKK